MTQSKHTGAPLSFNHIYNTLHAYRNGVPPNENDLNKALESNKRIHEERAELLEALELAAGWLQEETQDWHQCIDAIKKARGRS